MERLSRKSFIIRCIAGIAALAFGLKRTKTAFAEPRVSTGRPKRAIKGAHDLVVSKGADPYAATVKAIDAMGGMEKFVSKNSVVVIKPNIGWDRTPEQAANTNPEVVAALIDLSYKAGAKRVNIFDMTCNDWQRCYQSSGIEASAKSHGAKVFQPDDWNIVKAHFPYQSPMEGWPILKDAIDCDTFINVPVLKHHSIAGLTISMKNLMGVCGGNRGLMHTNIGRNLADLTAFINPDLTVVDAYRALLRHGPTGGDLADVAKFDTIIVGTDPVLADAMAASLMELDPASLSSITEGVERGLGSADLASARILRIAS